MMSKKSSTLTHTLVAIVVGLFGILGFSAPVQAIDCAVPETGNFTLSQSCTFGNSTTGNSVDGVYNGNLIIPSGNTLTINAGQTVCWYPGNGIQLNGGSIAINATGQLKECNVVDEMWSNLGADVYGAGQPVRVYDNNIFVCNQNPCSATAPSVEGNLVLEGVLKMTGGSPGAGKVLTSDANGVASWTTAAGGVPTGAVMAFNLASCPSGWTEYTSARGRYVVGLPSGGTLNGTAGTALSNLEDRPVGQHSHTITDPGHQHGVNGGAGWANDSYFTMTNSGTQYGVKYTGVGYTYITVNNAGTTAGTNAPYIQLLICQKS